MGFPVDFLAVLKKHSAIFGVLVSFNIPLTGMSYCFDGILVKMFLFLYSNYYMSICIGTVSSYTSATTYRLNAMKNFLDLKLQRKNSCEKPATVDDYATLTKMYHKVLDCVDRINVSFSLQLMIGVGLIFFYTLFTSFSAYVDFIDKGHLTPITISSISFCVYHNLFLAAVIFTCCQIEDEAQGLALSASNLIKVIQEPHELAVLLTFMQMIQTRPPKISCGFFDFDWKLIYSIISSAATNFVILMQFDLASRPK
jgi:7tm Chemosensory receptor